MLIELMHEGAAKARICQMRHKGAFRGEEGV